MTPIETEILGIPALRWGGPSPKKILAVHGMMSHKADAPIQLLADEASRLGIQVVSIDLPGHGGRRDSMALCTAQHCVPELRCVLETLLAESRELGLFGVSLGACFGLMAAGTLPLSQALLVSPVVDLPGLIEGMMAAAGVTPERLEQERVIPVPDSQPLDWDYYCFAREHTPAHWNIPTRVLIGGRDELEPPEVTQAFCRGNGCALEILPDAGHWLHTPQELEAMRGWIRAALECGCKGGGNRI